MASRFWVGGTGTWDSSTTTHWATSSNGAGGASAPGSGDTATFDGSSGGGTVTVNWASGTVTVQTITCGAFTGTLNFSANNNNVTLSVAGFNGSGSGTRTINLGNGTWEFTGTSPSSPPWTMTTTTGLTFNANSSILKFSGVFTASATSPLFSGGGLTYSTVQFLGQTNVTALQIGGANIFSTLTVTGPNTIVIQANQTITTLSLNGTVSGLIGVISNVISSDRTLSVAANAPTMNWCALRNITGTGGATFTAYNSFDLGRNTGITIRPPNINRAQQWAA